MGSNEKSESGLYTEIFKAIKIRKYKIDIYLEDKTYQIPSVFTYILNLDPIQIVSKPMVLTFELLNLNKGYRFVNLTCEEIFTPNEYVSCNIMPPKYNTYLVKTYEGCYDFAQFNQDGWTKGLATSGTPSYWRNIPIMA